MKSSARKETAVPEEATSGTVRVLPRLVDHAAGRFRTLCEGARFGSDTEATVATLRRLISVCGDHPIGSAPTEWVSEISDDNTPIEFSVAIAGEGIEVRVLFEPEGARPTVASYREAGIGVNQHLEDRE